MQLLFLIPPPQREQHQKLKNKEYMTRAGVILGLGKEQPQPSAQARRPGTSHPRTGAVASRVGPSLPRTGAAASLGRPLPSTDGSGGGAPESAPPSHGQKRRRAGGGSCRPATTPRLRPLRTGAVAAPRLKPPADGCGGGAGAGEIGRGKGVLFLSPTFMWDPQRPSRQVTVESNGMASTGWS